MNETRRPDVNPKLTTVKVAYENRPLDKFTIVRNGTLWGKDAYIVTGIEPDTATSNRCGEECFILHSPDKPLGERGIFGWATLEVWQNGTYPPRVTTDAALGERVVAALTDDVLAGVLELRYRYRGKWYDQSPNYWLVRLLEEVTELGGTLQGLHADSPDHELRQIASIALNWLYMRQQFGLTSERPTSRVGDVLAADAPEETT